MRDYSHYSEPFWTSAIVAHSKRIDELSQHLQRSELMLSSMMAQLVRLESVTTAEAARKIAKEAVDYFLNNY